MWLDSASSDMLPDLNCNCEMGDLLPVTLVNRYWIWAICSLDLRNFEGICWEGENNGYWMGSDMIVIGWVFNNSVIFGN